MPRCPQERRGTCVASFVAAPELMEVFKYTFQKETPKLGQPQHLTGNVILFPPLIG